jgi:hypothetical protein
MGLVHILRNIQPVSHQTMMPTLTVIPLCKLPNEAFFP